APVGPMAPPEGAAPGVPGAPVSRTAAPPAATAAAASPEERVLTLRVVVALAAIGLVVGFLLGRG
ncbi:MAG: hypothetical protein NDI82_07000, partial [Anaeromyxobacteraceae bacterium]|nr:hypothetical protein [Anaeromyxobacteraceae bacterium]